MKADDHRYLHLLMAMEKSVVKVVAIDFQREETVMSPTDVHAKTTGRVSIHTDSTADKKLRLINMGS
ncbi:hypothetical protein CDAR_423611 [Caerostris darwini]|uniref:Uncharacterized protein n=1 Tax=Caerostris darwini TaxID=1538125 RepID=A0AAV4VAJ0_9ARAC|nr:hypothetical protein CDAR_423611 [Caerostris darwini]